jgi:hypothetical protein
MRRFVGLAVAAVIAATGCGPGGDERKNDAGPSIQMNPKGPGAMRPPDQGGGSGIPTKMEQGKK